MIKVVNANTGAIIAQYHERTLASFEKIYPSYGERRATLQSRDLTQSLDKNYLATRATLQAQYAHREDEVNEHNRNVEQQARQVVERLGRKSCAYVIVNTGEMDVLNTMEVTS